MPHCLILWYFGTRQLQGYSPPKATFCCGAITKYSTPRASVQLSSHNHNQSYRKLRSTVEVVSWNCRPSIYDKHSVYRRRSGKATDIWSPHRCLARPSLFLTLPGLYTQAVGHIYHTCRKRQRSCRFLRKRNTTINNDYTAQENKILTPNSKPYESFERRRKELDENTVQVFYQATKLYSFLRYKQTTGSSILEWWYGRYSCMGNRVLTSLVVAK